MAIITRTYPTGTFSANDIYPLELELKAQALVIEARCQGINMTVESPDDTVDFFFDLAPNEVELDAAIAAYPSYSEGVMAPAAAILDNVPFVVYETMMEEGECLGLELALLLALGPDTDLRSELLYIKCAGHRSVGSANASVSQPVYMDSGNIPGLSIVADNSGPRLRIFAKCRKAGSLKVIDKHVEEMRGKY